jgi:hypothetical protein
MRQGRRAAGATATVTARACRRHRSAGTVAVARGLTDATIVESNDVAVLVLRDPDNIQIELCSGLAPA